MIRRLIILDSALVLLLAFGVAKFREDWFAFEPAHQVSAIQPKSEQVTALPVTGGAAAPGAPDWKDIPTLNPFSFDRNDIAILAPTPEPSKPAGPKPILFGTMTLGQGWIAMLASGQPNNRNSQPMKVGQSVDGWALVEINDRSVIIEANSNRETVVMNDPTVQISRSDAKTGGSSPAAAPAVQSVIAPATAPAVTTNVTNSGAPPSSTSVSKPGTPCVREIHTPFGPVRRPCEENERQ